MRTVIRYQLSGKRNFRLFDKPPRGLVIRYRPKRELRVIGYPLIAKPGLPLSLKSPRDKTARQAQI